MSTQCLLPPMLTGDELRKCLTCLPLYTPDICQADPATRLMALNVLTEIYIPSEMSSEIYSKLYLSMLRALTKKQTTDRIRQSMENYRWINGKAHNSVLGGTDSFSIIGKSGIGKSTAINKGLELAGGYKAITLDDPYCMIVPCVNLQCPHDCSVKGMLLSILGVVDERIGTKYRERAIKTRATTDILIGMVSQVALNHILLIVIDECQNILHHAHGKNVVAALTQLINCSGVSICMVGMPEMDLLFQQEMHLARRSIGLSYKEMPCEQDFISFCSQIFRYQYVARPRDLSPDLIDVFYQCSGGVIGIVISLFLEAQQVAILSGGEELTKEIIQETFRSRFRNIKDYVPSKKTRNQTSILPKKTETIRHSGLNDTDEETGLPQGEPEETNDNERLIRGAIQQGGDVISSLETAGVKMITANV